MSEDFYWEMRTRAAQQELANAQDSIPTPFTKLRPRVFLDGNQWCALYGADLQEGVAGFGDSPAEAMAAFDAAWFAKVSR